MENCRAEGRYWAKKIMKWYLTWICSDKEKINLFCFIHCVGKWEGGESARLNWWVWLLPQQACSRFDYNPTISQIYKYQISPMILTAQSLTRSSCLRVTKTPSARQQCWPESFCKSGKFLRQIHYWLNNFWILCNTKYPDNMQSVRMNWKVSGQSKKCPDNLENVSG